MTAITSTTTRDRAWLDDLYTHYHHRKFVHPDPLEFLYAYPDPRDREIAALVASALAYGNVKAMLTAIRRVLDALGPAPAEMLAATSRTALARRLRGFRYRFTSGPQLASLLAAAAAVADEASGLGRCLAAGVDDDHETIVPALGALAERLQAVSSHSLAHLLPHPSGGSACKRLNLMARWMVRSDEIDPGGWDGIRPALLVVPLDTHVHRTARSRGWTTRRSPDLTTALAVTAVLREIRPDDPLRYDFAMTRPGIRKEGTEGQRDRGGGAEGKGLRD